HRRYNTIKTINQYAGLRRSVRTKKERRNVLTSRRFVLLAACIRNAEVGSSSLLPSTKMLSKRGSFGCLFFLYRVLWTSCGQIKRVQCRDAAFERRMRVALEHPRRRVAGDRHHGVVVQPVLDHA